MSTCPVPCLESSPTPSHMLFSMYEKSFSKQRYLFVCGQPSNIYICGHTPIINCVDNPPIYFYGHTPIINCVDNPLIYYSGHTPINNCWSTLRNHVMHSHLLSYGVPVHMKCNMPLSCQFMLIYQACIY